MAIEKGAPDQLLANRDPQPASGGDGSFDLLKQALASGGATTTSREPVARRTDESGVSRRNGYPNKKAFGAPPRRPPGVHERLFPSVREKILSMYARGMAGREIQAHLFELYGIDFSREAIATTTATVPAMIAQWRGRRLEAAYSLVFFDALRVKVREEGLMRSRVVHIALGIQGDGAKEILGLWIADAEDGGFWAKAIGELKRRGVEDVSIAIVDGLKGLVEAIGAVFPRAIVQTDIVHLIRESLDFPQWSDRTSVAAALRAIHQADNAGAALAALDSFAAGPWGAKYPIIAQNWRRNWSKLIPFFALPDAVRRVVCSRQAIEALSEKLRRAVRARGYFLSDEAALFLVLRNAAGEGKMPPREWAQARTQLAGLLGEGRARA